MGIRLRKGRLLGPDDTADRPWAAVVNESFAKRRIPGLDPIGQRLHIGPNSGPWFTIVGVVADVKQTSLALNRSDAVYVTAAQWTLFADDARWLVIRSNKDVAALTPLVRRAIWSIDKDQPIVRIATMEDRLNASAAEQLFAFRLFETFGVVALVLAAIGTYGLLSGSVTERKREIGVRSALGATRRSILGLVLRQGMALTAIGIVLGLAGALIASYALVTLLFGVSRLDLVSYLGVLLLLAVVSAIACAIPAWRAARISPSVALRSE
jgi:putative ABC transport system permease protein